MAINVTWSSDKFKEDRVRARTQPEINRRIDVELEQRLHFYAAQDKQAISERIAALDREWDIERVLEANAATASLLGLLLTVTRGRKWILLPLVVSGFLLQHARQGWCPPVPLFRRLGVRTRLEIEQERYALKVLRGDFEAVSGQETDGGRNVRELTEKMRS
jgi:hypothetical protein